MSQSLPATARATVVEGLTPGSTYFFTLQAANSVGLSNGTLAEVVVPAVTPSAPQSLTAVAVAGGASLSWSAPAFDGGASITNYVVSYGTITTNLGVVLTAAISNLAAGARIRLYPARAKQRWLGLGGDCGGKFGRCAGRAFEFVCEVLRFWRVFELERSGKRRRRNAYRLCFGIWRCFAKHRRHGDGGDNWRLDRRRRIRLYPAGGQRRWLGGGGNRNGANAAKRANQLYGKRLC